MTPHDASIFTAGQNAGSHVAAGMARLAAVQLLDDAHWWNRWRRRLLARALLTYADEMEDEADLPLPTEVTSPQSGGSGRAMPSGPTVPQRAKA